MPSNFDLQRIFFENNLRENMHKYTKYTKALIDHKKVFKAQLLHKNQRLPQKKLFTTQGKVFVNKAWLQLHGRKKTFREHYISNEMTFYIKRKGRRILNDSIYIHYIPASKGFACLNSHWATFHQLWSMNVWILVHKMLYSYSIYFT